MYICRHLIEAPGFLENPKDPSSLIQKMSKNDLEQREAEVEGRMKRKMLALKKLFQEGATKVHMSDGRVDHPIQRALDGGVTIING